MPSLGKIAVFQNNAVTFFDADSANAERITMAEWAKRAALKSGPRLSNHLWRLPARCLRKLAIGGFEEHSDTTCVHDRGASPFGYRCGRIPSWISSCVRVFIGS
jgi:hypothetical protein